MDKDNRFEQIYSIMQESFPEGEYREYEFQKKVYGKDNYKVMTNNDENGNLVAFLGYWEFKDFKFIEHIAVKSNFRGNGIGVRLIEKYFKQTENDMTILDIETPNDELTTRRANFYIRLGFHLAPYFYSQPSLKKGKPDITMNIMSYPEAISFKEFIYFRDIIYRYVYDA